MKVEVKASAKINLLLDLVGRRDDGYHLIKTIMQSVDLYDTVTVTLAGMAGEIRLSCEGGSPDIPLDERNTAYKAALHFFKETDVQNPGILIHIKKRIPSEAGIAGGSADAAAVLTALNRLFDGAASDETLLAICAKIGADVPFCLCGGTMLAQGIGTDLSPLTDMPPCFIVLAKPDVSISTVKAYAEFDRLTDVKHPDFEGMSGAISRGSLKDIGRLTGNVFEQSVNVSEISKIKEAMLRFGAVGACMSGSGSTVFGLFEGCDEAQSCCDKLLGSVPFVTVCKPCADGCKIDD